MLEWKSVALLVGVLLILLMGSITVHYRTSMRVYQEANKRMEAQIASIMKDTSSLAELYRTASKNVSNVRFEALETNRRLESKVDNPQTKEEADWSRDTIPDTIRDVLQELKDYPKGGSDANHNT